MKQKKKQCIFSFFPLTFVSYVKHTYIVVVRGPLCFADTLSQKHRSDDSPTNYILPGFAPVSNLKYKNFHSSNARLLFFFLQEVQHNILYIITYNNKIFSTVVSKCLLQVKS